MRDEAETTATSDPDAVELPPPEQVLGLQPTHEVRDEAETTATSDTDTVHHLVPPGGATFDDGTIFISYSLADDQGPPFDNTVLGWVTFFWQQLRFELTNMGLAQAKLWRDRYEIELKEDFTPKIKSALNEARLAIMILSPNWASSPWCLREATYFAELHPDATEKTVLVRKVELLPRHSST